MLNARPIQKVGSSHCLGGCPDEAVFPPDLPKGRIDLLERLRHQLEVQNHIWERFQKEIIPELTTRQKWFYTRENVKVRDLMIETDETTPRKKWKRVTIKQVHPSVDSLVRRVTIEDSGENDLERPITRLVPIRI